jgi:holo-[acyl-carrier protein] synthase
MIYGVGTDLIEIPRIDKALKRFGERFARRILCEPELRRFRAHRQPVAYLAKRFAAKEAFSKALGTGVRPPATLSAMAVGHDELGKPILECYGRLAEMIKNQNLKAHLSISDEAEYAVAYVILEQA